MNNIRGLEEQIQKQKATAHARYMTNERVREHNTRENVTKQKQQTRIRTKNLLQYNERVTSWKWRQPNIIDGRADNKIDTETTRMEGEPGGSGTTTRKTMTMEE